MNKKVFSFVLAGGSGTRLAPLSLTSPGKLPKQYLALIGEKTLLQEAVERPPEDVTKIIVGEEKYLEEAINQVSGKAEVIAEPFGCNTAMAVGLAAIYARYLTSRDDTVIFIKTSDHSMDRDYFRKYFNIAVNQAKPGKIVTMGITPDRPETGLGYIKIKDLVDPEDQVYTIERFVEKPDLENAIKFVDSGEYFWNSGMFCFTVGTILEKLEKHSPIVFESLKKIEASFGGDNQKEVMKTEYENVKSQKANISIDFAVMEKEAPNILLVKSDKELMWDDIGLWIALKRYFPVDSDNNTQKGLAEFEKSKDNLVLNYRKEQKIEIKNLSNYLVVNTDNGIFVCPQSASIRAKEIVPGLDAGEKEILIDSNNIEIKNETNIPVACIDCEKLEIELNKEKVSIKSV